MDAGRTAKARELFEQAIRMNPQNWDAHGYLAEMVLDSDAWAEARSHLAAMEAIDPDSAVGNYLMATYQYRSRNLEQARNYAERVKAVRPGNAELRNLLGNIHSSLGQTRQGSRRVCCCRSIGPGSLGLSPQFGPQGMPGSFRYGGKKAMSLNHEIAHRCR